MRKDGTDAGKTVAMKKSSAIEAHGKSELGEGGRKKNSDMVQKSFLRRKGGGIGSMR